MAPIQRRPGQFIDTRALGQAVSFAGIDPRNWVSLAYVTLLYIDPVEGPFVNVTLIPMNAQFCARVGTAYAGSGFGDWCPVAVDDEVVVIAPDGEPAHGLIVVARLWSPSDSPPSIMSSNPNDRTIQARDGQNLWLLATGQGQVNALGDAINLGATSTVGVSAGQAQMTLDATTNAATLEGTSVALGSSNATEPVPLGNSLITAISTLATSISTALASITSTAPGDPVVAAAAQTLIAAAVVEFQAAVTLSTVVKTE